MKKPCFIILVLMLSVLPSLSVYAGDLVIEEAWVRMPPPVAETAAAYMTLTNKGDKLIMVESIDSEAAAKVEFHQMSMSNGMMHMAEMKDVRLDAGESLVFKAGSNHLMMIDLKDTLKAGDKVSLQLTTKDGSKYQIHAAVRDMRVQKHEHHH
ncbi:MAG: copper chaperone PCu(A)C [Mariprofundaceae bacterium]|nr:copper chaperone PCu(A)C [Mariprofundaceae bacterium]